MGIWDAIRNVLGRSEEADGFVPTAKSPAAVATRFVLVVLVADLAESVRLEASGAREDGLALRARTLDQLVGLGFSPADLEDDEQRFVMSLRSGRVARDAALAATWRLECAGVLAWALGLEAAILPIERSAESASLRALVPADAAAFRAFSGAATVRPISELMTAHREWSTRWFPLEIQPPSDERSRALERVRAIRWLTEPHVPSLSATTIVG